MAVPAEIRAMKPKGTEVHDRGGRYYVYEITSVWDKEKKRPKKKTLGCIGRIDPQQGFIPSAARPAPDPQGPVQVREYGLWALFSQLCPSLREGLAGHLGASVGDRAYAMAMLRVSDRLTKAQIARAYRGSWLSEELPGFALSEGSVTSLTAELGASRPAIEAFLRSRMPTGATLLFDGTQVLCSSSGMTAARFGRSGRRQINVMYVFDRDSKAPAWYRLLPGNVADVAAFEETLRQSGARECTAVADKGFFSKANVGALDAAGMAYVMPLRDNTRLIDTSFLADGRASVCEGVFDYHGRCVRWLEREVGAKGKRVVVYRDEAWAFLNRLSLTMFYALYAAVEGAGKELPARWRNPGAFIAAARNVSKVKIGQAWLCSEIPKPDRDAFEKIGVVM